LLFCWFCIKRSWRGDYVFLILSASEIKRGEGAREAGQIDNYWARMGWDGEGRAKPDEKITKQTNDTPLPTKTILNDRTFRPEYSVCGEDSGVYRL